MQARSNTSIIIVPGSFSPAFFYNDMVSNLKDAGLEAAVYDLPSANRKTPQEAASLVDDAEFFHQKASALTKQGKQVVLVAHSYGGLVASQCVEGLSKAERPGQAGFVQRIIYLTSVIPRLGQSLQSLMGTLLPEFIKIDGDFMYHEPNGSAKVNLSDMPPKEAARLAAKFSHHSTRSFTDALTYAGYRSVPSTFIMCDNDKVLPPAFQEAMIEVLRKESCEDVGVLHCDSGHCPNLSAPHKASTLIVEALS